MTENKFNDFLEKKCIDCEKLLKGTGAYDVVPEKRESKQIFCYMNLGVIYKYFGEEEKAIKMFHHLTTFGSGAFKDRLDGLSEESKNDTSLLIQSGHHQLRKGVHFNLAKTNHKKATQIFEWAAENCYQSDEDIAAGIKYELYDEIAVANIWRGYALINLGRQYEEAYELLIQVVPYLNKYKKIAHEMWRKVEYALPKALIPLCEYRLDPTSQNMQNAQTGIEDYIKSLRDKKDKLDGYLYYFHLKETNADVYDTEAAETDKITPKSSVKSSKVKKPVKKLDLPPAEYDTEGAVIVFDIIGGYLIEFGTNNELEEYAKKVELLGGYPVLASLMELYAMEVEEDPEPIIEECKRLLGSADFDDFLKEKTKILLDAALDAKSEGGTIMLYFDPEV